MRSRTITGTPATSTPGASSTDSAGHAWLEITLPEDTNPTLAFSSNVTGTMTLNGVEVKLAMHVIGSLSGDHEFVHYQVEIERRGHAVNLGEISPLTELRINRQTAIAHIMVRTATGLTHFEFPVEQWLTGRTTIDGNDGNEPAPISHPVTATILVDGAPLTVHLMSHCFDGQSTTWTVQIERRGHPSGSLLPRFAVLSEEPGGPFTLCWANVPA